MDIVFSPVALLNIHPLTIVNGSICYEIHPNDCPVKHVFASQSTTYIAMKHNDTIHIFNLKQDGVFPDEFKEYIEQIRGTLHTYFKSGVNARDAFTIQDEINRHDNPHNFAIIRQTISSRPCERFTDLSNAKSMVHQLNEALHRTCPDFNLHIDYITSFPRDSVVSLYSEFPHNSYFQPQIILCLFTGNDCVSSITIKVKDDRTTIDSKTNERYEGRKFNTLLRAVAIIISKSLNERAERLTSSAANIISALLMIKRFNAVSQEGDISKSAISSDKLDKVIKDYFAHNGGIETYVELNDVNIANAMAVFHETIQPNRMNCEPLKGGRRKIIKKCNRTFIKRSHKCNKRSHKCNKRSHKHVKNSNKK